MVVPSKSYIQTLLFDYINKWLMDMIDSVTLAAGEAYVAGSFHAVGQLRAGVGFDVLQKEAMEYAEEYRERLIQHGEIDVSTVVYGSDGMPVLNKNGTIKRELQTIQWLKGREKEMASDIADIIQRGIMEGKATGVRQRADGSYPDGSIAQEIDKYMSGYKSRAASIARTETGRHYYNGAAKRYAEAGVKYVKYQCAPDACDECIPYAGQVFALGTEPPLPIHPFCRCDYSPVSKGDADYPENAAGDDDTELIIPEGFDDM